MSSKTICLDFDGVIHSYVSSWLDARFIPDPPVPGALTFIKTILETPEYDLKIFSSRSNQEGGVIAMQLWLKFWLQKEFGWEVGAGLGNQLMKHSTLLPLGHRNYYDYFPLEKPPAWLTIDDRAFHFQGVFPSFEEINNFKPWNKK